MVGQLLLLIAIAAWIWCVVLTAAKPAVVVLNFDVPMVIALSSFFLAVFFSEYRRE